MIVHIPVSLSTSSSANLRDVFSGLYCVMGLVSRSDVCCESLKISRFLVLNRTARRCGAPSQRLLPSLLQRSGEDGAAIRRVHPWEQAVFHWWPSSPRALAASSQKGNKKEYNKQIVLTEHGDEGYFQFCLSRFNCTAIILQ